MADEIRLDELVALVRTGKSYRSIDTTLVRNIGAQELAKGRSLKEAVKSTRSRLHQAGSAYQDVGIDYPGLVRELASLSRSLEDPAVQAFCRRVLGQHASTRERLPVLERFFGEVLAGIGEVESVVDLACGLNPLAWPWMPFGPQVGYCCCDVYEDMVAFLNSWFAHFDLHGRAEVRDLTRGAPQEPADLALLLKTIPCLEQLDKQAGALLLGSIRAHWLLVTFPAHSLGGRSKGMVQNYDVHFTALLAGQPWEVVHKDLIGGELVFLLKGT